jgi:hypothetical protein
VPTRRRSRYSEDRLRAGPPSRETAGVRLALVAQDDRPLRQRSSTSRARQRSDQEPARRLAEVLPRARTLRRGLAAASRAQRRRHPLGPPPRAPVPGKGDEARKLVDGRDPSSSPASCREEGTSPARRRSSRPNPGPRARKARLILGDRVRRRRQGQRDRGRADDRRRPLLPRDRPPAGRGPGAAQDRAWEFLAKTDKEYSPLRLERMMMRHLVGELKDADLEAEAKLPAASRPTTCSGTWRWPAATAPGPRRRSRRLPATTTRITRSRVS